MKTIRIAKLLPILSLILLLMASCSKEEALQEDGFPPRMTIRLTVGDDVIELSPYTDYRSKLIFLPRGEDIKFEMVASDPGGLKYVSWKIANYECNISNIESDVEMSVYDGGSDVTHVYDTNLSDPIDYELSVTADWRSYGLDDVFSIPITGYNMDLEFGAKDQNGFVVENSIEVAYDFDIAAGIYDD